jgi:hypothetical protein
MALRECARLLKPGGTFWLATPNMDAPGHKKFGPHWRGLEPPRHLILFTADALIQAMTEAGFRDVTLKPTGPVSAWFIRASRKIRQGSDEPERATASWRDALSACWLDWKAFRNPRYGEELIATGTAPGAKPTN